MSQDKKTRYKIVGQKSIDKGNYCVLRIESMTMAIHDWVEIGFGFEKSCVINRSQLSMLKYYAKQ